MTPIEQDKELRKAIEEIIIADDYSHGVHMKTIDKMEKLITADRKRVALGARIDALEYAKISPKFKIEQRIEALKQELEKL